MNSLTVSAKIIEMGDNESTGKPEIWLQQQGGNKIFIQTPKDFLVGLVGNKFGLYEDVEMTITISKKK